MRGRQHAAVRRAKLQQIGSLRVNNSHVVKIIHETWTPHDEHSPDGRNRVGPAPRAVKTPPAPPSLPHCRSATEAAKRRCRTDSHMSKTECTDVALRVGGVGRREDGFGYSRQQANPSGHRPPIPSRRPTVSQPLVAYASRVVQWLTADAETDFWAGTGEVRDKAISGDGDRTHCVVGGRRLYVVECCRVSVQGHVRPLPRPTRVNTAAFDFGAPE